MKTQNLPDLFADYQLQREDILARIAESLQLDKTRKKQMEDAYNAVTDFISADEAYFKGLDIDLYPQGSVRIGTTVKPLKNDEFDLDMVLHIRKLYAQFQPQVIYQHLLDKLKGHGTYSKMVEPKNRCVRLNYAGQFHMDILPGCMASLNDYNNIYVPDRELSGWTMSNPKGYGEWFLTIANTVKAAVLQNYYRSLVEMKAEVEDLPDEDYYNKTPLQRAVQIIKRYRDIYFESDDEHATSSIVLTTLAAMYYNGEGSIYQTIENIVYRMQQTAANSIAQGQRFKVLNPVNNQEDFTDKWTQETYNRFYAFCKDFYSKWTSLKSSFADSSKIYEKVFGESVYKGAIKQQVERMGRYSSSGLEKTSSILLGTSVKTDKQGNLNETSGYKNERHRDFGGV
jgi:hypothetical protein